MKPDELRDVRVVARGDALLSPSITRRVKAMRSIRRVAAEMKNSA